MGKRYCICFLLGVLLFISCACSREKTNVPVSAMYNAKLGITVHLGMSKSEIDALFVIAPELNREYVYLYNFSDEENRMSVQYKKEDETAVMLQTDGNGWRIYDSTCYIGADTKNLSSNFHHDEGCSLDPREERYLSYCEQNGHVLQDARLDTFAFEVISYDGKIHRISMDNYYFR